MQLPWAIDGVLTFSFLSSSRISFFPYVPSQPRTGPYVDFFVVFFNRLSDQRDSILWINVLAIVWYWALLLTYTSAKWNVNYIFFHCQCYSASNEAQRERGNPIIATGVKNRFLNLFLGISLFLKSLRGLPPLHPEIPGPPWLMYGILIVYNEHHLNSDPYGPRRCGRERGLAWCLVAFARC